MPLFSRSALAAVFTVFATGLVPCRAANTSTPSAATNNNGSRLTFLGISISDGYAFVDFDGPNAGNNAGTGTNMNGLSNSRLAVGFDIDDNGGFHNFITDFHGNVTPLNINGSTTANAFGVELKGHVVGSDGNGNAFFLGYSGVQSFIPTGGTSAAAFGINNVGNIVGQYTVGNQTPGFYMPAHTNTSLFVRIDAPSGPDTVNAQGVNSEGEIVGFYVGADGQDHGFMTNAHLEKHAQVTGTPIPDPTIPSVPGEPGATFVFSQVLAVNDSGIAVGYYGDSTTSQHGFLYNLKTGQYTFVDDPAEGFNNGVEVTQITGIDNTGEITGFYSDANGVFHGFVALPHGEVCAVPQP